MSVSPNEIDVGQSITIRWRPITLPNDENGYRYTDYRTEIWISKNNHEYEYYSTKLGGAGNLRITIPLNEPGVYTFELREYSVKKQKWIVPGNYFHVISGKWLVASEVSNNIIVKSDCNLSIANTNIELGESTTLNWNVFEQENYYGYYTKVFESRDYEAWKEIATIDGLGQKSYNYTSGHSGTYSYNVEIYASEWFSPIDNKLLDGCYSLLYSSLSSHSARKNETSRNISSK